MRPEQQAGAPETGELAHMDTSFVLPTTFTSGAGRARGQSDPDGGAFQTTFGFLNNVAVDQHLQRRKRENDMLHVVNAYPELLGIGIDEKTTIVAHGDQFGVIESSNVATEVRGAAK